MAINPCPPYCNDDNMVNKQKQDVEKEIPRNRIPVTDTEAERKRVFFAPTRESSNSESNDNDTSHRKDLPGWR